jgi:nucleotide-binding universal stress UspA family protein
MLNFNPKNILVPVDLSEFAEKHIMCAKSIAKVYEAKLFIYHVIENLEAAIGYAPSLSTDQIDQIDLNIRKEAENYFTHIKNKFFNDFNDVTMYIEKGVVFRKIIEFTSKNKIDLIVIGTHGKSKLENIVFGSTTEKILRLSKQPILILKE